MYRLVISDRERETKGWLADLFRWGGTWLGGDAVETLSPSDVIGTAISQGRMIEITYQGGSSPGTPREVWPRAVSGGFLLAVSAATGQPRRYALDKITSATPSSTTS